MKPEGRFVWSIRLWGKASAGDRRSDDWLSKLLHQKAAGKILVKVLEDRSIADSLERLANKDPDGYLKVKFVLMRLCSASTGTERPSIKVDDHVADLRAIASMSRALAVRVERLDHRSPGEDALRHLRRQNIGRTFDWHRGLRRPHFSGSLQDNLPHTLRAYASDLAEEADALLALTRAPRKRPGGSRQEVNIRVDALIDAFKQTFDCTPHKLIADMVTKTLSHDDVSISPDAVRKRAKRRT